MFRVPLACPPRQLTRLHSNSRFPLGPAFGGSAGAVNPAVTAAPLRWGEPVFSQAVILLSPALELKWKPNALLELGFGFAVGL